MVKVVNVLKGPIHSSMVPNWDEVDDGFGLPYGEGYIVYATVLTERGVLEEEQLVFEDFDEAAALVDHFVQQIVPFEWEDV